MRSYASILIVTEAEYRALIQARGYTVIAHTYTSSSGEIKTNWRVLNGPNGKASLAFPTFRGLAVHLGLADPECQVIEHQELAANAMQQWERSQGTLLAAERTRIIECGDAKFVGLYDTQGTRVAIYQCHGVNAFTDVTETAAPYVAKALDAANDSPKK
jgi:hypothetical protein